ncbi:MAG: amino acid permease [Planctomycetes bacterium]|nr:amino acid permease [Planctomycetota bacterium]
MVGAGVFTTSGFTLQSLGSPRLVLLAWVVGGVIALAGAASYGQLIRAMPESGGEYVFLSRAVHPLVGFVAGWVSLIAGFTGAIAFAATALESYAMPANLRPAWLPANSVAVSAVIVGALFHGFKPRIGVIFQNTSVLLKLAMLAGFLAMAAVMLPVDQWQGGVIAIAASSASAERSVIVAFAAALVWISLSYSGFNAAVYIAEEAREIKQTVPKSLLLGTSIVVVLYLLLNFVFVYAPPSDRVAGKEDIAAAAAAWIGGHRLAVFVRVIISVALFTSVSSMMMAAPRVYRKMADDGMLPKFLANGGEAPRVAVAVQAGLAILFILISSLQGLLSYLGLTLSITAACSVACLFAPSIRRSPYLHPSTLPPTLYIVFTLGAAAIMTYGEPKQLVASVLTFLVGAMAYFITKWRQC